MQPTTGSSTATVCRLRRRNPLAKTCGNLIDDNIRRLNGKCGDKHRAKCGDEDER